MKFMRTYIYLCLLSSCICFANEEPSFTGEYSSGYEEISYEDVPDFGPDYKVVFERWAKATPDHDWVFEIKNDSKYPYFITSLSDGSKHPTLLGASMVGPEGISIGRAKSQSQKDKGYLRMAAKEEGTYTIWGLDPRKKVTLEVTFKYMEAKDRKFEVVIKENPKRKRIFLTIDESSEFDRFKVRPQKGAGIIKPVSQSGVPLQGNVTGSEIKIRQIE